MESSALFNFSAISSIIIFYGRKISISSIFVMYVLSDSKIYHFNLLIYIYIHTYIYIYIYDDH